MSQPLGSRPKGQFYKNTVYLERGIPYSYLYNEGFKNKWQRQSTQYIANNKLNSIYKSMQAEAVKEGYAPDFEGVKQYCEDYDIPLPDRRRHTSKTEWLAGMEEEISAMEQKKEQLEHEIKLATAKRDSVSMRILEKQLDEAKARVQYLEAFIERKEIAPFYRAYLGEKKQPTKAKSGWDIADEILR